MDMDETNPLLRSWADQPFHLPPFAAIKVEHFKPAFEIAMKSHVNDLEQIAQSEVVDFDSILAAYDRAGGQLSKVYSVYGNYTSSLNTPDLQEVQTEMAPILSRHNSNTYTIPGLFEKIEKIHEMKDAKMESGEWTAEQGRFAERVYVKFVRMGAKFDEKTKAEYSDIQATLAGLQTKFMQNVLKDEETWELVLTEKDMEGCPPDVIASAKQAARDRKKEDPNAHVITLSRSAVEPFLSYCKRRDLRKKVFDAFSSRGELSEERNNLPIAVEMLRLRKKQAALHGKESFSEYQFEDTMAQTPEAGMKLLNNVWTKAKDAADRERALLEAYIADSGETLDGGIKPHDWRYYAEKVRVAKFNFDENEMKPYFSLDAVTKAVFDVSNQLYGLKYIKRDDVPMYHPDVNLYEVRKSTGENGEDRLVALFIHDNFARSYKSSGAWMSEYRTQTKNLAPGTPKIEQIPIVSNNNNFAKGSESTLLSFDDGVTLFHEMGHGHHGMLSDCTYEYLASTNVLKDFVELPSQLMEHWLGEPQVLKKHARHYKSGDVIPDEMVSRFKAAELFNEGFATIEYTCCAMLDIALHSLTEYGDDFDLADFEQKYLQEIGMPKGIIMRHRPPHFLHLFASSSYASGYYVYMWAQVLDNDVFAAFEETGDVFDPNTAEKCRKCIYSAGNTEPPQDLFRRFRGREPDVSFMLKNRGLIPK